MTAHASINDGHLHVLVSVSEQDIGGRGWFEKCVEDWVYKNAYTQFFKSLTIIVHGPRAILDEVVRDINKSSYPDDDGTPLYDLAIKTFDYVTSEVTTQVFQFRDSFMYSSFRSRTPLVLLGLYFNRKDKNP